MFEHLLRQHVAFFDERGNSTGALCAKLSSEATYVQAVSTAAVVSNVCNKFLTNSVDSQSKIVISIDIQK